jgi:hypothetical protein
VTVKVYCKYAIQKERPHSCGIAAVAPCNMGISLLGLIRSYTGVLVQPLHGVMSVDGTTEMKACFFIAQKIYLQRVLLSLCLLKALRIPDIVSIIAEQFMHIA